VLQTTPTGRQEYTRGARMEGGSFNEEQAVDFNHQTFSHKGDMEHTRLLEAT
jgi:hypothetical protein